MKGKQYQHKKEGTCLCEKRMVIALERIQSLHEIGPDLRSQDLETARFIARNVLLMNEKLHRSKK